MIEKLEKKSIEGINEDPKNMAQCLTNIRKAFAILRKKP
jgi:hypothetical protein